MEGGKIWSTKDKYQEEDVCVFCWRKSRALKLVNGKHETLVKGKHEKLLKFRIEREKIRERKWRLMIHACEVEIKYLSFIWSELNLIL